MGSLGLKAAVALLVGTPLLGNGLFAGDAPLGLTEDIVIELPGDIGFGRVADVATDHEGYIYVLDGGFSKVHIFSEDGAYQHAIGGEGEGPGEFRGGRCLAVDSYGRVYVASRNSSITILDFKGTALGGIRRANSAGARSLVTAPTGAIFAVSTDVVEQTVIHQYATDGREEPYLASFGRTYAVGRDIDTRAEVVYGGGYLDIGPDGNLYYAQLAPQLVRVYSTGGELLHEHKARFSDDGWPPEPKHTDGSATYSVTVPMTNGIVALSGGRFIVGQGHVEADGTGGFNLVDLYSKDGGRLATTRVGGRFGIKCSDAEDRLYVVEERDDSAVVVRYVVVASESMRRPLEGSRNAWHV